jgi:hypothetical protein
LVEILLRRSITTLAVEADIFLDFSNTFSSISLLKMTEIFSRMEPLQILEIRGSDPDTRKDLLKVLPEATYDVLADDGGDHDGYDFFRVRIRKRGS